jgi:hypothetical protein
MYVDSFLSVAQPLRISCFLLLKHIRRFCFYIVPGDYIDAAVIINACCHLVSFEKKKKNLLWHFMQIILFASMNDLLSNIR